MSQQHEEANPRDITDDDLPDDLVPGEDNPLAEGLPPGETVEGLLEEGKDAEKTEYDEGPDSGEDHVG
ncbi:MAG TPA: hypothetical protein VNS55_12750 [Nocardioides sp.]|nr:hypothetical protein [Nocardioides sp.]